MQQRADFLAKQGLAKLRGAARDLGAAVLDDGMGFSLPRKPVIKQRLGQQTAAVVCGGRVTWEFGRQRGHQELLGTDH